ncbi:MAG: helix-turn-helix domain-containing protein [Dermatophilaceae bacterium]
MAITEDGRPSAELAERLKIDESLIDEWVEGESRPTVGHVTKLAEALRRPRAVFFLPAPPQGASLPARFRHPPGDDRLISPGSRRRLRQDYLLI